MNIIPAICDDDKTDDVTFAVPKSARMVATFNSISFKTRCPHCGEEEEFVFPLNMMADGNPRVLTKRCASGKLPYGYTDDRRLFVVMDTKINGTFYVRRHSVDARKHES